MECLIILVLLEGFNLNLYHTQLTKYYDTVQTVYGTVKNVQIKDGYSALTVDIGSENILLRLKNVTDEKTIFDLQGRNIKATGKITEAAKARNPFCFNYNRYLCARNIHAIIDVSTFKFEALKVANPFSHIISVLKGKFFVRAKEMMDEQNFSITSGILFGEKSYMEDDLYEQFQTNGIAHVLAVSGLHVGLVYGVINKLFKKKNKTTSIISIIFLFIYAAFANFSISVIRAAVMITFKIISSEIKERYDMLSAASFIAIVLLAINPYYIYDSGTQLSFLAAYSIAVLLPWFESRFKTYCDKRRSETLYKIGMFFLPGVVLQIGMAPLIAYHFLNFSLLSIFINPIAIYLASIILPAALVCFLVSPLKILFAASCGVCNGLCLALIKLSELSDKVLSGFTVPAPPFSLLVLYYLLLFFFFSETRHILIRKHQDIIVVSLSIALSISACVIPAFFGITQSIFPWKYNTYDYVFVDVGQGDCTHLRNQNINILIDGGKSDISEYLLKNGVTKIDLAIVTHLDEDHAKGIRLLSKEMHIKTIAFPESAKGEDVSEYKAEKIIYLNKGDFIDSGGINIKVLSAQGKDYNSGSLACLCSINDTKALMLADIPIETEEKLSFEDVDIVKIGHHGSKTSTSEKMLNEAKPEIAIISCGKNNRYGHPTNRVLELLENSGIIIKRTDLEGAICIKRKNIHTSY
ncbi:MAG: DNA internalization-related competence protein ComEC/Rec2 [Bacillota bacterium]|nr:DNA internalization-related competence protein ComEC/Rec2 [Bacillota bacterium]